MSADDPGHPWHGRQRRRPRLVHIGDRSRLPLIRGWRQAVAVQVNNEVCIWLESTYFVLNLVRSVALGWLGGLYVKIHFHLTLCLV